LRRAPIPAPSARPPGPLTYGDVLIPVLNALQNPAKWPQLAAELNQAGDGDGSALATDGRAALAGIHTAGSDAPTAIACADSPAREGPRAWPRVIARLTRVSALTGPIVGWGNWAPCASWPGRAADRYVGPWSRSTEQPILVIGTTVDPSTPYANARVVARLLGNAVLLTHDGYGHTSDADLSTCVLRATRDYLVDLATPPRGTVCTSDRQPFDPDFGTPPG
jgi:pimeloyl-ACP methyl ester carboxylesterase